MEQKKPIYGGSKSPDIKKPTNLTHLLNISSKFAGTGGSKMTNLHNA